MIKYQMTWAEFAKGQERMFPGWTIRMMVTKATVEARTMRVSFSTYNARKHLDKI